jgi:hypothetical protein
MQLAFRENSFTEEKAFLQSQIRMLQVLNKSSKVPVEISVPDPFVRGMNPDPLVGGMDPRIRILTKMSVIRDTGRNTGLLSRVVDPERIHFYRSQVIKLHSYFTKEKYCGIHNITVFKNTDVLLIFVTYFSCRVFDFCISLPVDFLELSHVLSTW